MTILLMGFGRRVIPPPPEPATRLIEAIVNKFNTGSGIEGSLYEAVGGRMYHLSVPEQEVFPYIKVFIVSETEDEFLGDTSIASYVVQFDIYSDSISSYRANTLYALLTGLYDDCRLILDNRNFIYISRDISDLSIDSDSVWNYMVRYRIKIQDGV